MNGAISIQEGNGYSRESQLEFVKGLSFDSGFLSPYFADDREKISYGSELGTVYIALVDGVIETELDLVNLLEFAKKTQRPLLVIAEDFSSQALTAMVVNRLQLGLKIVPIKTPML